MKEPLAQRLRPGGAGDADIGDGVALLQALQPPDALRRREIFGAGSQIIGGLQRQIGTRYGHFCGKRSLLNTKCCGLRIA